MKPVLLFAYSLLLVHSTFALLPCLLSAQSFERSVIAAAGGNLSNASYTLTYTLGETIAQTFDNGEQLSQGFQQVWAITTAVDEIDTDDWEANVYPNPTIGILTVETEESSRIRLFDAAGRMVMEKNIEAGKEEMNLSGFPAGMYTLQLNVTRGKGVRTFRIVKVE